MKYNKLISLGLAALTMVSVVGCGKKNTASENASIEYWHVAAENFGGATVRDLASGFNEKAGYDKVKEKYNADMYKGLTQNLQAALASGQSPDVVQMGYSYLNYASENLKYVTPQEIVDKYFPEDKDFLKNHFTEEVLALGQVDGKQIGIPYSISNPIMYYNADLLKAAGVDKVPETWEEVVAASKKVKDNTQKKGFYMQEFADNWAQQGLMEGNGASMLGKVDGKVQATFATKEAAEAYDVLYQMIKDGTGLHVNNEEGLQAFLSGEVAMCVTTVGKRANFEKSVTFDLKAAKFPVFGDKARKAPAGGNFLVILADTEEEQKAAWEFMKYLLDPSSVAKWTEGTGYLPPTTNAFEGQPEFEKFMTENQIMSVAHSQMDDIVQWASFPGKDGLQAEQVLIDTRDIILSGKKPALEALQEAQDKINNLIK